MHDAMLEETDIHPKPYHSSHSTTSASKSQKVFIRSKLNDKVFWDGLRKTFSQFEKFVDGHLLQVGAGYIANTTFLATYINEGRSYIETQKFWDAYDITERQAKWDKTYMYGIIQATTRRFEDKTTNEYKHTQDGFSVWAIMKRRYANGGNRERQIDLLETAACEKYSSSKHPQIVDYIDNFERTVTQLSTLCPDEWTDSRKKKMLRTNLLPIGGSITHLVQTVKDNSTWTFGDMVEYLLDAVYAYDDKHAKPTLNSLNHAMSSLGVHEDSEVGDDNSTTSTPPSQYLDEGAVIQVVKQLTQEIGLVKAYNTLQAPSVRESLSIPSQIWTRLEPAMKQRIEVLRKEIRAEQGNRNPPPGRRFDPKPTYPPKAPPTADNPPFQTNTLPWLPMQHLTKYQERKMSLQGCSPKCTWILRKKNWTWMKTMALHGCIIPRPN